MSILPLLSSPFMNDKLIYRTTILLNNSQGGNAFWPSYLVWTVIGEEPNTAFRNSLFWPEVLFHRHRNEWLSNPTVDLEYPLEFGLSTSALSIGSTFAYTTPFSRQLKTANNNNNNIKKKNDNNIIIIENKRQKQITKTKTSKF